MRSSASWYDVEWDPTGDFTKPLRWEKPSRFYVKWLEMHAERVPPMQIAAVFGVMAVCPQHTFVVQTVGIKRLRSWFEWIATLECDAWTECHAEALRQDVGDVVHCRSGGPVNRPWPLPNVWIGTQLDNQADADAYIPELFAIPAAARFARVELRNDPVELHRYLLGLSAGRPAACQCGHGHGFTRCPNYGSVARTCHRSGCRCEGFSKKAGGDGLHWVIVSSAPGPSYVDVAWFRSLRDRCKAAGVPFYLEQAVETDLGVCGDANNPNGDSPCGKRIRAHVVGPDTASYSCGCCVEGAEDGGGVALCAGEGSRRKPRGVIELPYLDGVQHLELPEVFRGI